MVFWLFVNIWINERLYVKRSYIIDWLFDSRMLFNFFWWVIFVVISFDRRCLGVFRGMESFLKRRLKSLKSSSRWCFVWMIMWIMYGYGLRGRCVVICSFFW